MKKSYFTKGFTLIELLVVVGILAVLAIAALIAINPLEAQRRSRDSARLQDMARLSASVEAFMNDFGNGDATVGTLPIALVRSSTGAGNNAGIRSQACNGVGGANWLGVDLCPYLKQVPLDPQNGRTISTINTVAAPGRENNNGAYGFISAAGNYEFCVRLEDEKNRELLNDGGTGGTTPVEFFETGSVTNLACTP